MKPAAAGGSVLRLLDRALPAFHIALTGAADAESGLRHILSDGRTGGGGCHAAHRDGCHQRGVGADEGTVTDPRSEEHTSELQSRPHLVCRLLLEKKKKKKMKIYIS